MFFSKSNVGCRRLKKIAMIFGILFFCLLAASAFAANTKPSAGTITPSSGSSQAGQEVTLTATYIDVDGWQDMREVNIIIYPPPVGTRTVWARYVKAENKLYLKDKYGYWMPGVVLGSKNTDGSDLYLENPYGRLNCTKTTVSGSGTTLTVNWVLTFGWAFLGSVNAYLQAFDAVSQSTIPQKATWTITPGVDSDLPQGTVKINNDAAFTNAARTTLYLSATDATSGMWTGSQMQFSNDGTTWSAPQAYNTTKIWMLPTGDGAKTVYVKFKDTAGNWSIAYSDTIHLDTTLPVIKITSPLNNAYTNYPTADIAGTINDSTAVVTVNSAPVAIINGEFSLIGFSLASGMNTITARAQDLAGNVAQDVVTITLDTVAPDFTITSPQDGQHFAK